MVFLSLTVTKSSSALALMVLNKKVTMLKLHGSQLPKDSTSNFLSMTMTSHLPVTLLNTRKGIASRKHSKGTDSKLSLYKARISIRCGAVYAPL